MALVSVLVPIYGVESYIERCARSLFEQTYKDIEYIFVDDCSPDKSVDVLKQVINEYPERKEQVKLIKHEKNKGLAAARKTATLNASSDYIIHIDSDDFIEKNAVELLMDRAVQTDADMVICNMELVYSDGRRLLWENNFNQDKHEYVKLLLKHKSLTCLAGRLIRKSIVVENNLFTREGLNQGEDYVIVPIISYHCKRIVRVETNAPLYFYVKYNDGAYTANIDVKAIENNVEANDYLSVFFSSVKEKDAYKETIQLSKLYNKLTLLLASEKKLYPVVGELYKDISYWGTKLESKFKILLFLVDLKLYGLSYYLVNRFKKKSK